MLFLFLFVWLPCSIFIGWLASKRGRSGIGWGLLSLLLSPVICLLALLLLSGLKIEAAKQTGEESHSRDQLAGRSDVKTAMQAPDVAPQPIPTQTGGMGAEWKSASRAEVRSTATQTSAIHRDKPQSEAANESVSMSTTPVAAPAMADYIFRSTGLSVGANKLIILN